MTGAPKKEEKIRLRRRRPLIALAITVILTGVMVRIFFLDTFIVDGNSMAPRIQDGDVVFVNKAAYTFDEPGRSDIVVSTVRNTKDARVIKRIVGLPREWITIATSSIAVSKSRGATREELPESYLEYVSNNGATTTYRLDPYEYFLLGDNRQWSVDSRELGPVSSFQILGKLFLRFRLKDMSIESFI